MKTGTTEYFPAMQEQLPPEPQTFSDRYDIAIIGGGAAGLAAAISYLRREGHGRLIVVEANDVCGKKLLATGNGRCNISNLSADGYQETKEFFKSIGVLFRVEQGGRAFPMSGQAASVRDALLYAAKREGAEIRYSARVSHVEKIGGGNASSEERIPSDGDFSIYFDRDANGEPNGGQKGETNGPPPIRAGRLLIATGGKAGPQFGCFGDGYAIARSLGHSVESIRPALVPLIYTEQEKMRLEGLAGVRIRAKAELLIDGKTTAVASGELQLTAYGLSGVMIFDLSTMMPKSIIEGKPFTEILLDFAPGEKAETLEQLVRENSGLRLEGVVGKKLSDLIAGESDNDAARMAGLAKGFRIQVCGTKGWKEAQATLGGIRTSEIDQETGESLICKGVFFTGEVLEPVFICGGFNLDHAWTSGLRAGEHM